MKYRKLTDLDDYTFGQNTNNFVNNVDAVAQAVKTKLKLLMGEWWENTTEGLPLFQNILGQSGVPDHLKAADYLIQEIIANTQGVISIANFSSSFANRQYAFSCIINTAYGPAVMDEQLGLSVTQPNYIINQPIEQIVPPDWESIDNTPQLHRGKIIQVAMPAILQNLNGREWLGLSKQTWASLEERLILQYDYS